jgi:hypothetical protein
MATQSTYFLRTAHILYDKDYVLTRVKIAHRKEHPLNFGAWKRRRVDVDA